MAVSLLVCANFSLAQIQPSEGLSTSTYEAFTEIAEIYQSGGEAPELVAKLNIALDLIQQAQLNAYKGDEASAFRLREQARAEISGIMSGIQSARQRALRDSATRTVTVLATVPIVVALSTLVFFAGLRVWRWYEKMKFLEMRIFEKENED